MLSCKSCCYCGQGKDPKCPFYSQSAIRSERLSVIERDAHKNQFAGLYWAACLLHGYGTQKNERKAVSILEKLAHKDYVPAKYLLSLCYFDGIKVRQNPAKAFELCQAAANKGCNLAEIKLYHCYRDGEGVCWDMELAKKWCGYAAGHQSSEVYYEYAELCCLGNPEKADLETAVTYYKRAADNGCTEAQEKLKELHRTNIEACYEGQGNYLHRGHNTMLAITTNENFADYCMNNPFVRQCQTAFKHYGIAQQHILQEMDEIQTRKKAAEENRPQSRYERVRYEHYSADFMPFGGPKKAKELDEKIKACLRCYFEEFDPKNKELFDNALAGQAWAQNNIGVLFSNTKYDLYDCWEAKKWFSLAAQQGNKTAQSNLEICKRNIEELSKPHCECIANQNDEKQRSRALDEQMRRQERHETMRRLNDITTFSTNPDEVDAARKELYDLGFYDNV